MRSYISALTMVLVAASPTILSPAFAANTPPQDATPMNAKELSALYSGKSWAWRDGAGYLQPDGRRFTAWSRSNDKLTYAKGQWRGTDSGRLCFLANW
jgi:hypothetical protein